MYIPILNLRENVKYSFMNIIITLVMMFIIYSLFFSYNKNHFNGAEDLYDIWYFTTTTHSTCGYGDITPKTKLMKLIVSCHQMLVVIMTIELIVIGFSPL